MEVSIQTKLENSKAENLFLEETANFISNIRSSLLKDLLSKKHKLKDLKRNYIASYQITARQFNSLACEVNTKG
jgi:hypothetical protein